MPSLKSTVDAVCPPFLRAHKERIEASPLGRRLARGAFWSLVGAMIARTSGLVSGILVARILGKHDFGQLGMIQSTVGMFGTVAGFGMGLTATKHVAEFRTEDPSRAGRIIVVSGLVAWGTGTLMSLVLLFTAPWLAVRTLAAPEMAGLLRVGALLLLLGGVNGAQTGALAGFEAFKAVARINLVSGLLSLPITVLGTWWWGVLGAVWAQVACLAVNCVLNYLALLREARKAGVPLRYQGLRQEWPILWRFSVPAVLGGLLSSPIGWAANTILVNQTNGYSEMGVYNAALRVRQVPEMILGILLAPLLPVLSEKFSSRNSEAYRKAVLMAFSLSLVTTVPFALLFISAPSIAMLPYGKGYTGNNGTVQLLMLDLAVVGLFSPLSTIITSMNRMWFGFFYNLCWGILYSGLVFLFVPGNGAAGISAALAIGHLLITWPCLYYIYWRERDFVCGIPLARLGLSVFLLAAVCLLAGHFLTTGNALLVAGIVVAALAAVHLRYLKLPRRTG